VLLWALEAQLQGVLAAALPVRQEVLLVTMMTMTTMMTMMMMTMMTMMTMMMMMTMTATNLRHHLT
jgi:hypothetical protein